MARENTARGYTPGLRAVGAFAVAGALTIACEGSTDPTGADSGRGSATSAQVVDAGPPCQTPPLLTLDLDVWRRALAEAEPDASTARDRLLAQAGLRAMPETPGAVSVDISDARLGEAGARDKIVQARYAGPDGTESLRVAILRPVPEQMNTYCMLGSELSHDTEPGEEPCITEYTGPARRLSLTQVIAADRDTVEVRDAGGWCGSGGDRGDRFAVEYWGDEGGLVRYFQGITFEAWYQAPFPPARELTGTVEWVGDWPKTLVYTATVTCNADIDLPSGDCVPAENTTSYHYRDGRYVPGRGDQ